ncbi:MAG: hypothetical protein QM778_35300 [Myxococcales bacterium]
MSRATVLEARLADWSISVVQLDAGGHTGLLSVHHGACPEGTRPWPQAHSFSTLLKRLFDERNGDVELVDVVCYTARMLPPYIYN